MNLTLIKKNPLSITTILAHKLGIFDKYNVNVNLSLLEDFSFGGESPYYSGKSDGTMGDITFFFYALEKGKKSIVTSNLTRTIMLVGRKDLPDKLEGIKVGVNRTGLFRLFLENDLKDKVKKPEIVWINNTYERMQALKNKEIDALVAIEPFVTDVVNDGGKILWSSRESNHNFVSWFFDEGYVKNNPEEVKNFHKALKDAGALFNNASKEERVRLCKEVVEYSEEISERLKDFTFELEESYSEEDFNICQYWMIKEGEINNIYNPKELIF